MRISYNWLKEYVDTGLDPKQLSDRLTMAGLEVEGLEYLGEGIEKVVVGRIASIKPHPDADKLTVCEVDTGSEVLKIVCGAKNMKEGDKAPLALAGAKLPGGIEIKKGKLRGVASCGMLCSEKELGLAKESAGLLILPESTPVGEDIVKTVGLDDWAMEINVTPNRPDCLCVIGIAREAAVLTRRELRMPEATVKEDGGKVGDYIKVEIKDPRRCPRYAGRMMTGIKVGPSPAWMRRRLAAVGVRAINNVVDVTNFVMMETGQPLHAFDYDLLEGRRIVVRTAVEGEVFTTLDDVERRLSPDMLLICDANRPVAVAGVMGGRNSEVGEKTVNVFLESAYFDPASVRRTSKRLGLHTEASHRFERGTDPEGVTVALDRAAALIAELCGGRVAAGREDEYPGPVVMPEIAVRPARVRAVLGAELDKKEMQEILTRLQMHVREKNKDTLIVKAPTFRPDMTREADIMEEIARIYGYGKIRSVLPRRLIAPVDEDAGKEASDAVKDALLNDGYYQVINYSFINPQDFDRIKLPGDDCRRDVITLQNPLSVEQSVMRTTLVPSLLGNLALNFSRGVRDLKIFEISKAFLTHGPGLPDEPLMLAALAAGGRTGTLWDGKEGSVDFFDLKGVVETVVDSLRVPEAVYRSAADIPFLHPGKAARLMVGGGEVGFIGQVHPDVMAAYDLPLDAFIFELKLGELIEAGTKTPRYSPLPKFPAVERDIAAIVQEDITAFSILKTIESLKISLVEDIRLFDFYAGKPIPDGRKSLAFRITYRSGDRTLTDEEVNKVHQEVMDTLKERLGAEIRNND